MKIIKYNPDYYLNRFLIYHIYKNPSNYKIIKYNPYIYLDKYLIYKYNKEKYKVFVYHRNNRLYYTNLEYRYSFDTKISLITVEIPKQIDLLIEAIKNKYN